MAHGIEVRTGRVEVAQRHGPKAVGHVDRGVLRFVN